jgi:hypothetical protein
MLLSDITTPCGRKICSSHCQGKFEQRPNWPTVMYPWQAIPNKLSWAFWRRALQLTHLRNDKQTLQKPLGQWHLAENYHHQWRWNFGPDDLFQSKQNSDAIRQYPFKETVRRQFRFLTSSIPETSIPHQHFSVAATTYPRHMSVPFYQIFCFPS